MNGVKSHVKYDVKNDVKNDVRMREIGREG
jgi:hypothetical protein